MTGTHLCKLHSSACIVGDWWHSDWSTGWVNIADGPRPLYLSHLLPPYLPAILLPVSMLSLSFPLSRLSLSSSSLSSAVSLPALALPPPSPHFLSLPRSFSVLIPDDCVRDHREGGEGGSRLAPAKVTGEYRAGSDEESRLMNEVRALSG